MPSHNQSALLSEEDIRTRVVATWLADHGFTAENISVEFSFELRLGRNVYRVGEESPHSPIFRPRADVLVRSSDGRNLLIIEVKAPNEILDANVKAQGISYARLLKSGGIAPFVVITNGHETQIYDSITEEAMQDAYIPTNHPHAQNRFRVSVDDIALRAEALETFISLSSDNLLAFCRVQVAQRMRLLRSDDSFSGKKYIPALYIEREDARKQLHRLLHEERRQVVLLVGAPQVGKTNFVCHSVEERLESGQPCLFYSAIGMEKGLLEEIGEDFNWIFDESATSHRIIHKLTRVLQRTNQRLLIFIDGWNEASQGLARAIDRGSERLAGDEIQVIVSFTNVAARRLLLDEVGNLSYVAESASISTQAVSQMEVSPKKVSKNQSRVFITRYSPEEMKNAYKTYAQYFKVTIANRHQKVADPLLLRIGMEHFTGRTLPETLDEPQLLEQSILSKTLRVADLEEDGVKIFLRETADEIFIKDAPVSQAEVLRKCGLSIVQSPPIGLFEAALLTKVCGFANLPALDFYYSRERDFVIAFWSRNWLSKFQISKETSFSELSLVIQTQAGIDSLRWFLIQPDHKTYLQSIIKFLSSYNNPGVRKVLLSSLWESMKRCAIDGDTHSLNDDWITNAVDTGIRDMDRSVTMLSANLLLLLSEYCIESAPIIALDEEILVALLSVEKDFPIEYESASFVVLDALLSLHIHDEITALSSESGMTKSLINLVLTYEDITIRQAAAKGLAYIASGMFIDLISRQLTELPKDKLQAPSEYVDGLFILVEELEKLYYGSTDEGSLFGCYGDIGELERMIDNADKTEEEICLELIYDYKKLSNFHVLLSKSYSSITCIKRLEKLVRKILFFSEKYAKQNNLLKKFDEWLSSVILENKSSEYLQLSLNIEDGDISKISPIGRKLP